MSLHTLANTSLEPDHTLQLQQYVDQHRTPKCHYLRLVLQGKFKEAERRTPVGLGKGYLLRLNEYFEVELPIVSYGTVKDYYRWIDRQYMRTHQEKLIMREHFRNQSQRP